MAYFKDGKTLMDQIHRMANRRPGSAHDIYTLMYFAEIGPDRLRVKDIGKPYCAPMTPASQAVSRRPVQSCGTDQEQADKAREAGWGVQYPPPLETACDVRSEGDEYHCVRAKCHLRWDMHEDRPECPLLWIKRDNNHD